MCIASTENIAMLIFSSLTAEGERVTRWADLGMRPSAAQRGPAQPGTSEPVLGE
jgi:hypothetical protein